MRGLTNRPREGYNIRLDKYILVPYLLIERYRSRPDYPSDRGLALDCSVLSIFNSLGQVLSGLLIAKLISVFGNSIVINPYSAILTLFGLLIGQGLKNYFMIEF